MPALQARYAGLGPCRRSRTQTQALPASAGATADEAASLGLWHREALLKERARGPTGRLAVCASSRVARGPTGRLAGRLDVRIWTRRMPLNFAV